MHEPRAGCLDVEFSGFGFLSHRGVSSRVMGARIPLVHSEMIGFGPSVFRSASFANLFK